uniref:RxLR effector candidate protein n=2 Tax=Hyaloperonospora arabidopsidis (strain Emoy2) TaxID=559515 RepID=M4BFJ9_HYAAE|nr:RxLR effector candidate protein [Hyaloperonospora arabidopsidis Emoy2]
MTTHLPHVSRRDAFPLWMYLIRVRRPCSLRMARLNRLLGQTSQHWAICQEIRLVLVMFWHPRTRYAPNSTSSAALVLTDTVCGGGSPSSFHQVPFRLFVPPLAPLSCLDGSMVGPRAQLESTMRLDELAETCTTPAGIETTTFTHLPQPCDGPLSTDRRVLRQRATKHHGDDCADPTGLLSPCSRDVSPYPLSPQPSADIALQSLDLDVDNSFFPALPYGSQLACRLSASTRLERNAAAAGCRAGDMNHDATLRRLLFRKGSLLRSLVGSADELRSLYPSDRAERKRREGDNVSATTIWMRKN